MNFAYRKAVDLKFYLRRIGYPLLLRRSLGSLAWKTPMCLGVQYVLLGDQWVGLTNYLRLRRQTGLAHRLCLPPAYGVSADSRKALMIEVASTLGVLDEVIFSDCLPDAFLPPHPPADGQVLQFQDAGSHERNYVAYQFDGYSHSWLNPTEEEMQGFLSCFSKSELIKVGRPLTIQQSADVLKRSKLFIGVSSGMSHIAASAGVKQFIYLTDKVKEHNHIRPYPHLRLWNPYRDLRFFSNLAQLKAQLDSLGFITKR